MSAAKNVETVPKVYELWPETTEFTITRRQFVRCSIRIWERKYVLCDLLD